VTSLSPARANAGGGPFTLTINGAGFTNKSIVFVNNAFRASSFVSSIAITVQITALDIATPGAFQVGVSNFPQGAICSAFAPYTFFVADAPAVGLAPSSLNFGNQPIGTTSAAKPVTLTNTGTGPLTLNSIVATGDYGETNTCASPLAPGAQCTINATFHPTAAGTRTGQITITDNAAGGSPQTIALTGVGATVSVTPASLSFPNQTVGTTSGVMPITLKNTGPTALTISSIVPTGDYGETNTCVSPLAAGTQCAINVTFHPTMTGTRTGQITITDSGTGSPQVVALTGVGATAAVTLTPASLSFPNQTVGTTSASKTVTLKNTGNGALSISSIFATVDYAETNNCGSSLAAGASCTLTITFHPTATGMRTGGVFINDNASCQSTQAVALTGTGQ
jgi:hypothetical protein